MTLMEKFVNGLLIGIEGIDGCGKSTFATKLAQALELNGLLPVLTREPGGTKFGLQLRQILQYRDDLGVLDHKAEYLLFAADRAQHVTQVIKPNLQAGKVVISDRTGDSSLVYQGYGRGLDLEMIRQINHWAMSGVKPNLIIYLKIDAHTAQTRVQKRAEKPTAFEEAGAKFLEKLINGFEKLYTGRNDVLILDGNLSTTSLVAQAVNKILELVAS